MTYEAQRDIYIPSTVVRTPSDGEMYVTKTVRGNTLATHGSATNSLLGYKFLRTHTTHFELLGQDGVTTPSQTEYRTIVDISPMATHLWVGFWYYAKIAKGSSNELTLKFYDYPGASGVSDLLVWDQQSGLTQSGDGVTLINGAVNYQDNFVSTGWGTTGDSSQPKLIDVSEYRAKELEARINIDSLRLYSMIIHEVYYDII